MSEPNLLSDETLKRFANGELSDLARRHEVESMAEELRGWRQSDNDWRRLSELQSDLLVSFRLRRRPSEKLLGEISEVRKRLNKDE